MMLAAVYVVAGLFVTCVALVTFTMQERYRRGLTVLNLVGAGITLALAGFTRGIFFNYDGYFGDFWTATDALNKAQQGLASSVDFFSPIGPAYFWIYGLTARLSETTSASTVMHAGAVAATIFVFLATLMLLRRISLLGLSIVLFSVVTVATSGRGNGEMLYETAMHFLAPYNRWAWALFIPVVFRLCLPSRERDLPGDVAVGLAVALLLLIKVTYGAGALGLLFVRSLILQGAWRELPVVAGVMAASLAAVELATGQVSANLHDLATTAALPQSGLRVGKLFIQLGEFSLYTMIGIVAFLVSARPPDDALSKTKRLRTFLTPILMIVLAAGAGCAVLMQNHYAVEAAIYPLLPLIALEWTGALRAGGAGRMSEDLRGRVLVMSAVLFMMLYPLVDLGMHVGQRLQYQLVGPDPALAGTRYADLRFEPYLVNLESSLLNTVSDGHAGILDGYASLVEAGAAEDSAGRVAALNFANPFPMMLDQPSPSGTPIWLHEGRSFSSDVFVAPEVLLDGVDYVMVESEESTLWEIYGPSIKESFRRRSAGRFWSLYVRDPGLQ